MKAVIETPVAVRIVSEPQRARRKSWAAGRARRIAALFVAPAAIFLLINGLVMFGGEALKRRRPGDLGIEHLTFAQSVVVGIAQSFALLPGISRSGASMVMPSSVPTTG